MADHGKVDIVQADITSVPADAIVNAANSQLTAGGGVCGAIFRAAGHAELSAACARIGHCDTGEAVLTPAFGITTARFIIHAVGPIHAEHSKDEARELLRKTYASAIATAAAAGCQSIALPAISTGIYGYPLEPACREAVEVCRVEAERTGLHIKLVAFDDHTARALKRAHTGLTDARPGSNV
jgi:O-acetyl-ADP-ribose deacetylase